MLPVLALLAQQGLSLITNAVLAKGKDAVEKKLGIKIPTTVAEVTPELTAKLQEAQNAHEEFLITSALEEKKIEIAAEAAAAGEVSERWKADMASDSPLSKNVRPGILIYLTLLFSILVIVDANTKTMYVDLLGQLMLLVYAAYFLGRTAEKGYDMYTKMKGAGK